MTSLVWIAIWCASHGHCQLQAKAFETEVACLEFVIDKDHGNCWFNEKGMKAELRKQRYGYR